MQHTILTSMLTWWYRVSGRIICGGNHTILGWWLYLDYFENKVRVFSVFWLLLPFLFAVLYMLLIWRSSERLQLGIILEFSMKPLARIQIVLPTWIRLEVWVSTIALFRYLVLKKLVELARLSMVEWFV